MSNLHWVWKTILIFYVGRLILRIAGRKSISQMTITQVVVMVGIGSLLIQPVAEEDILKTFGVALVITLLMILTEYLEMKFDVLETISTGKAKIVIENGEVNLKNLSKLRMSIDRMETRLRQSGISSIEDVKYATIEVSGQLGYELKDDNKPATKGDIKLLMMEILQLKESLGIINNQSQSEDNQGDNIFEEIQNKKFEGENEP